MAKDLRDRRAYKAAWYEKNRERISKRARAYYLKHRDEICAKSAAYHKAHPGASSAYQRKRRKIDPQFKMRQYLRTRLNTALQGAGRKSSTLELLGCSLPELKAHLEAQFRPGMTWANWTINGWHIDHIEPLASFDLEDPQQLAQAAHYTNLQPLWAKENLAKHARIQD